jgi:hypothetical protein
MWPVSCRFTDDHDLYRLAYALVGLAASGHCAMVSDPEETHERIVAAANAVAVSG